MSVEGVDLNLLVALDHLLREQNVTRAARAMGLSQPAMSAALARLRRVLDDPLLVRAGRRGMTPTPRALALIEPVRASIVAAESVFAPKQEFDPAQHATRFTIAMSDYPGMVLLPGLASVLAGSAVEVRVVAAPERVVLEDFETGRLDLLIGFYPDADAAALHQQHLYDDEFVLLGRRGHPAFGNERMTAKRFAALDHLLVAPQGQLQGLSDRLLTERGLARRIALRVPHFQLAPIIVAESDLVVLLTTRVARRHADELSWQKVPFALPRLQIVQLWHRRSHASAPHRWLRATLRSCVPSPDGVDRT